MNSPPSPVADSRSALARALIRLVGERDPSRISVAHIRRRIAEVIHDRMARADAGDLPQGVPHGVTAVFIAGARFALFPLLWLSCFYPLDFQKQPPLRCRFTKS
ncbi:hypothetical protein ACFFMN_39360 [Planobispora siamensis]|uniref:Uncharacterized protein n=1 Tax=Planobispora siamensis TaxID=936338 RepID=A0A8J3SL55_9ACTN|nr:hypothetical protein [Planobispora siamensis]GIH96277.1 hypothetical protein Psi01_69070 [Planobispora siamensis]